MALIKPVPIGVPNLRDVPEMLRKFADDIDKGIRPPIDMAVLIGHQESGDVIVCSWGDVPNVVTACGLLQWGIHSLVVEVGANW